MSEPTYWTKAVKHLRLADPILSDIIDGNLRPFLSPNGNVGNTLIKSIVGQQISVKAADSVWRQMEGLLGTVVPENIVLYNLQDLRGCGLSMRKSEYILDFSRLWVDSLSDLDWFSMDGDGVRSRLLEIRGVGPWTVDMVMIFALGQPDILPLGDIGLIRAIEKTYAGGSNLGVEEILGISTGWSPYRTVATWYLWRVVDPEPVNY
ncbi:MAG TPA: DNA-3-methyladenine glycosylase 2 family protein [Candidatus Poseidoniales archaeon]|nr:MAG TPA: DNA-3-methyladenine glycosylase 2 family protein [Candidatus Poseidoniales archaeon]|tara:strand:- start:529 stop:1146 length:618 start_codon:yes stop_codon:yes gene_type:complete